jgi:glycosyltransferase involved in cell wall biosynthesis
MINSRVRIYLHDYGRYPFIGQLARALAARGHVVALAGSGGDARRGEDVDSPNLEVRLILPGTPIPKSNFAKRARHETKHGKAVAADMAAFRPDVVISANAPTLAQKTIAGWCASHRVPFVFWLQDLLGAGAEHVLAERFGSAGRLIGRRLSVLEHSLLRSSDHVVAISEAFKIPGMTVIPNWAPLGETPVQPRDNDWSCRHGLTGLKTILYSGTLGMKHDPQALIALAESLKEDERLVVVAEGAGADVLREANSKHVTLLPLQPYADLPQVLASGDVLLATLLPEAGAYCVPSKVLTYFCAARPVILSAPLDNDASQTVTSIGAGTVVAPGDVEGLKKAARNLLDDEAARSRAGVAARSFAEQNFDIESICDRFQRVVEAAQLKALGSKQPTMKEVEVANEG